MGGRRAYKLQEFPAHAAAVNSIKIGYVRSSLLTMSIYGRVHGTESLTRAYMRKSSVSTSAN